MSDKLKRQLSRWWPLLLLPLLSLPWLLPLTSRVGLSTGGPLADDTWPQIWVEPSRPGVGEEAVAWVRDREPWPHVRLTANGQPAEWGGYDTNLDGTWTWRWHFRMPDAPAITLAFYHNCDTGCTERGQVVLETARARGTVGAPTIPTKLLTVFPDPDPAWYGRSGWGVELTYAQLAEAPYWGVDDLAARVQ
ncbi:MAG: hypothetical protein ACRDIB_04970, partial [Ardenticatenaceae bacterium]